MKEKGRAEKLLWFLMRNENENDPIPAFPLEGKGPIPSPIRRRLG
jgi:hypothetical protein